jgi:hypothetical protein
MKKGKRKSKKDEIEVWKPIDFVDKPYEISNHGRIKSYVSDPAGKILKCSDVRGFQTVGLMVDGEKKQFAVHKLTAQYFILKEHENQTVVIHKDWDKSNNKVSNLEWVTSEESYQRMHKKILDEQRKSGRTVTNSKLKPEDIVLLKTMLNKGIKQNVIARLFAISEMQVTRIKRNENWSHIVVPDD